jgi:hypothetical protein
MNTILSIVTLLELKINECQKVECIITQAHKCLQEGKKYNGTINYKGGVPRTIKRGSVEEQIIVEKMENSCSFRKTQM